MTDNFKFAFLNADNKVINVAVFDSENPEIELLDAIKDQIHAVDYKSCSIYGEAFLEGHFINDHFVRIQPYPSWILNQETYEWQSPIPMPVREGYVYYWDEQTINWVEVEIPQE